jgi:hypothetical protein
MGGFIAARGVQCMAGNQIISLAASIAMLMLGNWKREAR